MFVLTKCAWADSIASEVYFLRLIESGNVVLVRQYPLSYPAYIGFCPYMP